MGCAAKWSVHLAPYSDSFREKNGKERIRIINQRTVRPVSFPVEKKMGQWARVIQR